MRLRPRLMATAQDAEEVFEVLRHVEDEDFDDGQEHEKERGPAEEGAFSEDAGWHGQIGVLRVRSP